MIQPPSPQRLAAVLALAMLTSGFSLAAPQQSADTEVADSVTVVAHSDMEVADSVTVVDESHYKVYTSDGEASSWAELALAIGTADAVLVGEYHDDPVAHYLEAKILEAAIADTMRRAVGSMEMFTSDVQGILDEYLSGMITERHFLAASQPWGNYETDYRPFVEIAREAGRQVIAANAPRRYVNRVTRMGPESLNTLSDQAKASLPPLPYSKATDAYKAEWMALMTQAMAGMTAAMDSAAAVDGEDQKEEEGHNEDAEAQHTEHGDAEESDSTDQHAEHGDAEESESTAPGAHAGMAYMLDSQSLWDASMAFSIADHLTRHPGDQVVHIVGGFHVRNGTGIPEHLARYRPGISMVIIAVEPVADVEVFDREEFSGVGDFVILADESLPRTKQE